TYPELKEATTQAFTNNYLYLDGYARTMMPYFTVNGERMESLALTTYRMYAEKNGLPVREFTEDNSNYLFTYTKKTGGIEHISISKVLSGETVGADYFDGRIVMVGAYATGFQDDFPVPVNRGNKMYGVEIHANTVEAIHANKLQSVADKTVLGIIYALLAAILVIAVYFFELPLGAIVTFGSVILHLLICSILYKNGLYLKIVYFTLPAVIIYLAAIIYRYALARAAEAQIKHTFKQYLSPDVVDELVKSGADNIKLNGLKRQVAVFFIDVRGFTTMSEGLDAETVVKILNQYFELVTSCIFEHQGMLDKFIGDAAMAVFNAPNDLDNYIHAAVNTAWDIRKGFDALNEKLSAEFGKKIDFGIGINCGEATVGNIGSSKRLDYTAIGDTVNTASRLEGKAKAGHEIVVSQEVYDRFMAEPATPLNDEIRFAYKGDIELKGKFNAVPAYSVLWKDEEQKKEPEIEPSLKEYIAYVEAYEKLENLGGSAALAIREKLSELEAKEAGIAEKYKVYRINHIQK
ncbi:MAG: adenylate/guanylate cyclase domain-containing protein, partial [Lachnospiraceae bacterium]|nr:adenylate/guanylate cyclase domain-containing protein [Lachnospiraceae bacterium]